MDIERGRVGANRYGGRFYEEFLPELSGQQGIKTYTEMSQNDATIGAILFAIKNLIRQASWTIQPGSTDEHDREVAKFVESCMHDMSITWTDFISEVLSFLVYGWSIHEIVYKRRRGSKRDPKLESKYDDGRIGWQKLPIRSQESLYEWDYDEHDNLRSFVQMPAPDYELIRIPAEKLLLFRTESRKDNPEGRSILRNAYRAWYFKKRIEEIEGIGIERDLAGFPVLVAPEGLDIWNEGEMFARCNEFVKNIRRDALEGFVMPAGWKLELLSTGGRRQFDTSAIISRYDQTIARTVLADFIMLGSNNVGSWALSSDKTAIFATSIGSYLDAICEVFNRKAIPQLLEMNRMGGNTPKLIHSDIETQNLTELGQYMREMCSMGLITPDDELENYLREQANLPLKTEGSDDQVL